MPLMAQTLAVLRCSSRDYGRGCEWPAPARHSITRDVRKLSPLCRVELICILYGRLVDRSAMLTAALRTLERETLVLVCQRLGYCNVFCPHRPALFYRLRMWHAGEAHVAHKLYKLACKHGPHAIRYLAVDGELKKAPAGPCAPLRLAPLLPVSECLSTRIRFARSGGSAEVARAAQPCG